MGRPQLQHHLLLRAQVQLLQVAARVQVKDVDLVAVFAAQQQLGNDAVLHHVGSAPFGGDHDVMPQMPPEIVSQLLRTAVLFPGSFQLKRILRPSEKCRPGRFR